MIKRFLLTALLFAIPAAEAIAGRCHPTGLDGEYAFWFDPGIDAGSLAGTTPVETGWSYCSIYVDLPESGVAEGDPKETKLVIRGTENWAPEVYRCKHVGPPAPTTILGGELSVSKFCIVQGEFRLSDGTHIKLNRGDVSADGKLILGGGHDHVTRATFLWRAIKRHP